MLTSPNAHLNKNCLQPEYYCGHACVKEVEPVEKM